MPPEHPDATLTLRGAPIKNAAMSTRFDSLAAAEALENAGFDREKARVMAAQLQVASDAGEPVTRPALEAALGALRAELLERIAKTDERITSVESSLIERIAKTDERITSVESSLIERITKTESSLIERIAKTETSLIERIAETERRLMDRTAALVWRLFGAMVALAGLAVAALKYLP